MDAGEPDQSEDFYPDGSMRRMDRSLFCGKCGYNLRTLPYAGRCPECGNEYNARTLKMRGILIPQTVRFPTSDLVAFVLAGGAALMMFEWFRQAGGQLYLGLAGAFGVLAAGQFYFLCREMMRFVHCHRLVRQIRAESEE